MILISFFCFDMLSCDPIQRRDDGDPLWTSKGLADTNTPEFTRAVVDALHKALQ